MTPEEAVFLQWYYSTPLAEGQYPLHIAQAMQDFRWTYEEGLMEWIGEIMDSTILYFTRENGAFSRWPQTFLRLFNRPNEGAFVTFAQPKHIERRKQAVAVWYTLLYFLAFLWSQSESDRAVEKVGLRLNEEYRELLDDMWLYATLTHPKKPRAKAMAEKVVGFFWTALRDPIPTVQSNPILWWMAVLIQMEVENSRPQEPRLPVPDMVDRLTFAEKLDALEHYARVILVREHFGRWLRGGAWHEERNVDWRREVVQWLDRRAVQWVDDDEDAPPNDFLAEEDAVCSLPAWQDLWEALEVPVRDWLDISTRGPMQEVLMFRRGQVPPTRPPRVIVTVPEERQYRVQLSIVENWTFDPVIGACYPAQYGVYENVEDANRAARRAIENECGPEESAVLWGESFGRCEEARVRAVFINAADNAKLVAWVEVEPRGTSREC